MTAKKLLDKHHDLHKLKQTHARKTTPVEFGYNWLRSIIMFTLLSEKHGKIRVNIEERKVKGFDPKVRIPHPFLD